jgi:hypothetical protein
MQFHSVIPANHWFVYVSCCYFLSIVEKIWEKEWLNDVSFWHPCEYISFFFNVWIQAWTCFSCQSSNILMRWLQMPFARFLPHNFATVHCGTI